MEEVIANFEGIRTEVYTDTKGLKTVGVGFDDVFSGKKSITRDQALKLFAETLKDKVQTTKRLIPNYDNLPGNVQTALVNAVFRGELKSTHKTVKFINSGEWDKVADEYLDRGDYREASKPGSKSRGIKTRMDYNANIFREYAKKLKK